MPTQKTPLTRIDDTGAATGQGLVYDGDKIAWGDVATGSVAAGFQTKHTITATQTVSSNQQYQVFGTLNIADGGTITLAPSGDLVLDAPDDPNKAAGWARNSNTNAIATDHSVTVANSISAQGDVYGNARTMTNPGVVLQVIEDSDTTEVAITSTSWVDSGLEITITPTSTSSKILLQAHLQTQLPYNSGQSYRFTRDGTSLHTPGVGHGAFNGNGSNDYQYPSISQLDAPATTSAIVYKVQIRGYTSTASNFNWDGHFRVSLLAMEVAG